MGGTPTLQATSPSTVVFRLSVRAGSLFLADSRACDRHLGIRFGRQSSDNGYSPYMRGVSIRSLGVQGCLPRSAGMPRRYPGMGE